ncbi:hypothetical protein ILYODFUR_026877 [Ilyodon furcidens]|uniref:Uncharacterized protein n=1 Tax=Ilyodon furcidens TaxID=33524 RepID=A0ABV0SRS3_9TELE
MKFKARLGFKMSQALNISQTSIHHLQMEGVSHICKPTKTWLLTYTGRSVKESINKRNTQNTHGHSGGAAEIHGSGERIRTFRHALHNFIIYGGITIRKP